MKPAIFLDRDDTLIRNVPYLGDPSKVVLCPGAVEALTRWQAAGFLLFVVSNQSGVGRGLITKEQVAAVNAEMMRQLGQDFFAGIYNCYAAPEDPWDQDRKPSPAMVLRAAHEHGVALAQSFMVGDRLSDVQCGQKAGCRTVLLLTEDDGWAEHAEAQKLADFVTTTLLEAVEWTLQIRGDRS